MRLLALTLLLAGPAQAWEAIPGPICTLTHQTPEVGVELTYDPALPLYAITLTRRGAPWIRGPVFAIRFDGPRGRTISTGRHILTKRDRALTVADTGFGNVLDGLQFNETATALLADAALTIPLDGAAAPVAEFRACATAASA